MQSILQNLGWVFLIVGIILVCLYVFSGMQESSLGETETQTQSKGVILLGPIPIVWGYGRRGWMIAGVIAVILVILWIVFLA